MNTFTVCLSSFLVVAAFLTASTSGYGFRLVDVDAVCDGDEEFALHEDCSKYYICDNGRPILAECPPPLFFSLELGSCDFPENVPDCIGGTRDPGTGTDPTLSPPPSPTTQAPGTTVIVTEPPVTTGAPEVTTRPPVQTTEPEPEISTPSSGICPPEGVVFLPFPGDCQKYYICADGVETEMECADGTLYDEELQKCNLAEEVDCHVETTAPPTLPPTTNAPVPSTTEGSDITCPADGIDYIPDPTDCQKYFLCVDGEAIPEVCADGLLFDPVSKQCKLAEDVDCVVEPQCPADGIAYLPVPGSCVEYIMCVSGVALPRECADGTEFDPEEQECVLDANYDCPFRKLSASAFLRRLRH